MFAKKQSRIKKNWEEEEDAKQRRSSPVSVAARSQQGRATESSCPKSFRHIASRAHRPSTTDARSPRELPVSVAARATADWGTNNGRVRRTSKRDVPDWSTTQACLIALVVSKLKWCRLRMIELPIFFFFSRTS